MGLASIGLYHIKCEESRKTREKRLNQIQTCKELSNKFWDCVNKHNTNTQCGPEYFKLTKCIEKLR